MMLLTSFLFVVVLAAAQGVPGPPAAADNLAAVKHLYASASYEEALVQLSALEEAASAGPEQVEQYRALCLLGLGRTDDARRSLERMVTEAPLYTIPESEVSPRLVEMFRDVRKRLLPVTAKNLYARGKTSFDLKKYAAASADFTELLSILGDRDMPVGGATLDDMKTLAEGFQQLAEMQVAAEAKARSEAQALARATAAAAAPVVTTKPAAPMIYAESDADVVRPVDIQRRLPAWNPPTQVARSAEYRGVLEIVISERGTVDTAILRDSVSPFYDEPLLAAAMEWRFKPATRNGQPVKYLKLIEIVHSPR